MEYELKIQLNRIEEKLDAILINSGLIETEEDTETNNMNNEGEEEEGDEGDEEGNEGETENGMEDTCRKCGKLIIEPNDKVYYGTETYHKKCKFGKEDEVRPQMRENKTKIGV